MWDAFSFVRDALIALALTLAGVSIETAKPVDQRGAETERHRDDGCRGEPAGETHLRVCR